MTVCMTDQVMISFRSKAAGLEAIDQLAKSSGLSRSEVMRQIFRAGFPVVQRELKKQT